MTPLSLPIPLRSTTVWGGYREAMPIPHRYGNCSGSLLQYDDERRRFVWSDHAVEGIDEVVVNDQAVGEWEHRNVLDSTGHPIAMVIFGQPQDEGVTIKARGRGKRHPGTGQRMTNPADVVWDVLANIAGRNVSASALADFRRECEREGLEVGGSIETADSTQSIVRSIAASVGAIYCADMPGVCRLWPGASTPPAKASIRRGVFTCAAGLDDIANDLTVQYAWEDGQPRASVQLDAPDSVARYSRRPDTLAATWVTSARVALAVGRRVLMQRARPQWAIQLTSPGLRRLSVGDAVSISHPLLPVTGTHVVLSRTVDLDTAAQAINIRVPAGDVPAVRLVGQSAAFDPAQYSNVAIETVGGSRILTLREPGPDGAPGAPIIGAKVTLDGGIVAYTDAGGRVSFPVSSMPPGWHRLVILTTDGRTLTTDVLV